MLLIEYFGHIGLRSLTDGHLGRHLEYFKTLNDARVASVGFIKYNASTTRINKEKNFKMKFQVILVFYWTIGMCLYFVQLDAHKCVYYWIDIASCLHFISALCSLFFSEIQKCPFLLLFFLVFLIQLGGEIISLYCYVTTTQLPI